MNERNVEKDAIIRWFGLLLCVWMFFVFTTYDIHHEAYLTRQELRRLHTPEHP